MMTKKNLYKVLLLGLIALGTLSCSKRMRGICDLQVPALPAIEHNTKQSDKYVVVLSMDGFRYDYQTLAKTPNLDQMDKEGLSGKLRPCYPSLTFPNHYSMATGLYPNNHGIVANTFWLPNDERYKLGDRKSVENPKYYLGEPIWNVARKQGLRSASYFWVGSETAVGGMQPNIWKRYNPHDSFTSRADSVISWLQLPEQERPHLIMWYLSEPDHNGHTYGPEAKETRTSIEEVDAVVGHFRKELAKLPIAKQVDFIVVADHGMAQFDYNSSVNLADYVKAKDLKHIATGPFTHIYPKQGKKEAVYQALKNIPNAKAYYKEELPKRLHFGSSDRIGDIVVIADLGAVLFFEPNLKGTYRHLTAGHGFDNKETKMQAVFKAVGPSFEAGRVVKEAIPNITLYPLICDILELQAPKNDADDKLAKSLLKK